MEELAQSLCIHIHYDVYRTWATNDNSLDQFLVSGLHEYFINNDLPSDVCGDTCSNVVENVNAQE